MKTDNFTKIIADVFTKINDKSDFEGSLKDILTPAEIEDISERIEILKMLKEGIPQREIAEKLGISITTVTRGNRIYKYDGKAIIKYI